MHSTPLPPHGMGDKISWKPTLFPATFAVVVWLEPGPLAKPVLAQFDSRGPEVGSECWYTCDKAGGMVMELSPTISKNAVSTLWQLPASGPLQQASGVLGPVHETLLSMATRGASMLMEALVQWNE